MRTYKLLGTPPQHRIHVPQHVIQEAVQGDSSHCMIADAIRREHPEFTHIAVDIQTIRATNKTKGERYIWLTPKVAQRKIIEFDQGRNPAAFALQLSSGQTVEACLPRKAATPAQKASAAQRLAKRRRKRARLVPNSAGGHSIPHIIGGHEPPKTRIGARRAFGLRSMQF